MTPSFVVATVTCSIEFTGTNPGGVFIPAAVTPCVSGQTTFSGMHFGTIYDFVVSVVETGDSRNTDRKRCSITTGQAPPPPPPNAPPPGLPPPGTPPPGTPHGHPSPQPLQQQKLPLPCPHCPHCCVPCCSLQLPQRPQLQARQRVVLAVHAAASRPQRLPTARQRNPAALGAVRRPLVRWPGLCAEQEQLRRCSLCGPILQRWLQLHQAGPTWYWQCRPSQSVDSAKPLLNSTVPTGNGTAAGNSTGAGQLAPYAQCGGQSCNQPRGCSNAAYAGVSCYPGYSFIRQSNWHWQCLPQQSAANGSPQPGGGTSAALGAVRRRGVLGARLRPETPFQLQGFSLPWPHLHARLRMQQARQLVLAVPAKGGHAFLRLARQAGAIGAPQQEPALMQLWLSQPLVLESSSLLHGGAAASGP